MNSTRSLLASLVLSAGVVALPALSASAQEMYFGLLHEAVGGAKLDGSAEKLVLSNLNGEALDGVRVYMKEPATGQPVQDWQCTIEGLGPWASWGRYRYFPHQKPAFAIMRVIGPVNGEPDVVQAVAQMQAYDEVDEMVPSVEFPGLDVQSVNVQYLSQGKVVHELNGLPPGTPLGSVCCSTGPALPHSFSKHWVPPHFWVWMYDVGWQAGKMVTPDGLEFESIDQAYVYPIGFTAIADAPTSLEILSNAQPTITITSETWTSGGVCYPECDGDGALSIDDFICFQTFFALGDIYADCDGDGALSIDDFICFQTYFALGC